MKEVIYLAGGCFWGVDAYFKDTRGVLETEVGYANGKSDDTFYENLKNSDHAETVKVVFDKEKISLDEILENFYYIIDPFSINKQGADVGRQYRSGVYSDKPDTLKRVEEFFAKKRSSEEQKIEVEVESLKNYVVAEEYHQDYLKKNPNGYCHINLADRL